MRYDPFRDIEELQRRMDQTFRELANTPQRWAPPVDIYESPNGLELQVDLPGVASSDIQVEAENNTLSVQAERKEPAMDGMTAHRNERIYGKFVRSFSVPNKYDLNKIEASFANGVLTLKVPRSEAAMKRQIAVQQAS
jgi:HSP20 family protein